jgi:hypothetical protein
MNVPTVKENTTPNAVNSPKKRKVSEINESAVRVENDPRQCSFCLHSEPANSRVLPRCAFKQCGKSTCFVCGGTCEDCGVICCSEHFTGIDINSAAGKAPGFYTSAVISPERWVCKICMAGRLCGCVNSSNCLKCQERWGRHKGMCFRCCSAGAVLCHRTCGECSQWRCTKQMLLCSDCNTAVCSDSKCAASGKKENDDYWCRNCYAEII